MSQRYGIELAYRGTAYAGWQQQPNAVTVEGVITEAVSIMLGQAIKLVGCGRTDAGVHASDYVAHFDYAGKLPERWAGRLNRYLPEDIAVRRVVELPPDTHARFSATSRSYVYRISPRKDPLRPRTVTWLPALDRLDRRAMEEVADLVLQYTAFAPFCKSNSDAYTMNCLLHESRWEFGADEWRYHVTADRFLRGMVRLIVGACLRVGEGRVSVASVRQSLERQAALERPWSAPAAGLFLSAVRYPRREAWKLSVL